MQFKYPEIFYSLLLLLIPIFIHLFQLRKFEKVAFTNVAFLKRVELQTRKSSKLKHFFILLARLGLFTALIFAFAQPFLNNNKNSLQPEVVLYLDNSMSMQAKNSNGTLLTDAIQNIIENNESTNLTVLTNDEILKSSNKKELKNQLLSIEYSPFSKDIETVLLEANNIFKNEKGSDNNLVLISDFQSNIVNSNLELSKNTQYSFVQSLPNEQKNISIDSVFISKQNGTNIDLQVIIKSYEITIENLSVSLYRDDVLIGKTTCSLEENNNRKVKFSFPFEENFNGRVVIEDNLFSMDNTFFFSLNKQEKIQVLAIGENTDYLSKIYSDNEFNLISSSVNELNYNLISSQNILIINELNTISIPLQQRIKEFISNGGSLVIIPSDQIDIANYNSFFKEIKIGTISKKINIEQRVTSINFEHSILENVFEKKVTNFQYPTIKSFYTANLKNSRPILKLENQKEFISQIGNGKIYWVASSLRNSNSNFKNSPLIVPVFYNFGKQSHQLTEIYYTIDNKNTIIIKTPTEKNMLLSMKKTDKNNTNSKFIPLQVISKDKVTLELENIHLQAGFYSINKEKEVLQNVSFNNNRIEGAMNYTNMQSILKSYENSQFSNNIAETFNKIESNYKVTSYWKYFILLALLFLMIEMLLIKFW